MIWAKLATDAIPLSVWLWQNRQSLGSVFPKANRFFETAISDPLGAVRRIGSAIVFDQADGEKVLGFIEQTTPKLDFIQ